MYLFIDVLVVGFLLEDIHIERFFRAVLKYIIQLLFFFLNAKYLADSTKTMNALGM